MAKSKVLIYNSAGLCFTQSLHCASEGSLGDSDSGQYSRFLYT
jgi:hypothetical protein